MHISKAHKIHMAQLRANTGKTQLPPTPPPTRMVVNHKQIKPLTEGKMRHGVKPQGPQNEVIKSNKFDWYCFGLGWAVASLFFGTLSFFFGG